ncbi:MAG: phage tail tip lysozyme [Candidatus Saccharimonadales bacterium]
MSLAQIGGQVMAENTCPAGMSNLDCQALNNDWTAWIPNVCGQSTGISTPTLVGTDNITRAFNYFMAKNVLTTTQVAALLGNLYNASNGLVPTTTADGKSDPLPIPNIGFGIAQWSTAADQQGLIQLAAVEGNATTNLGVQLDYVWQELTTNRQSALQILETDTDIVSATDTVLTQYLPDVMLNGSPGQIQTAEKAGLGYATAILALYGASAQAASNSNTANTAPSSCSGGGGSVSGCNFGSSTGPFTPNSTAVTTSPKEISVTQLCNNAEDLVYNRSGQAYKEWEKVCNNEHVIPACTGLCDTAVAIEWGYTASGYEYASNHWAAMVREGYGHPVATNPSVAMSPPVGALLFYKSWTFANHVAVYLGNNMVMSTDVIGPGVVGKNPSGNHNGLIWIAPETTMMAWSPNYLGWSEPIYTTSRYQSATAP